ncbi:hypothetical protein HMPREF0240_01302 [Clostridium sp. D5]|nr:hypothetical protein HMPREF0240_01302 [Clostridium sp. D5]
MPLFALSLRFIHALFARAIQKTYNMSRQACFFSLYQNRFLNQKHFLIIGYK